MGNYLLHFAQAYGSGTYSSCAYSEGGMATSTCATSSAGPVTNPNGLLANTGIALLVIVTLACLLIFTALLVRIWRRKPAPVLETVLIDEETKEGEDRARQF